MQLTQQYFPVSAFQQFHFKLWKIVNTCHRMFYQNNKYSVFYKQLSVQFILMQTALNI